MTDQFNPRQPQFQQSGQIGQPAQGQPQPGHPAQGRPQPQQGYSQQYSQQISPQGYPQYPQSQQFQQPTEGKRRLHHSYVWLAAIQLFFSIAVALVVGLLPIIFGGGEIFNSPKLAFIGNNRMLFVLLFIGGLLVIAGLTIGFQILSYRNIAYEVDEKEFSYYFGILNKKRVHVPYQRIQSVNQKATLIQRIVGVCTISIDTAGGSNNKAIAVPFIQNSEAERLRSELFTRKQILLSQQAVATQNTQVDAQASLQGLQLGTQVGLNGTQAGADEARVIATGMFQAATQASSQGMQASNVLDAPAEIWADVRGVFGGASYQDVLPSHQYGLSNKELIFTGLSNNTGVFIMFFVILGAVMGFLGPMFNSDFGKQLFEGGLAFVRNTFAGNIILPLVLAFIVFLLFLWLVSIINTCISYGGFKAARRENRIEIEHGLLQHRFHGVDVDRVQSVIIKQSFIRRLIGYCELSLGRIDALVESSQEQQQPTLASRGMLVHPFVKVEKVPEILAGLLPEFAGVPTETIKLPPIALRRALIRRSIFFGSGFWIALITAIVQLLANNFVPLGSANGVEVLGTLNAISTLNTICYAVYGFCVLLAVVEAVNAVMWFRGSSFAYNEHFMQITNGGFSRESISLPRKKIQYGFLKTNPFQRAAHVATVKVRTAAGVGGTTMKLLDVREKDAKTWLTWLLPGQQHIQQDEKIFVSKNTTAPSAAQSVKLSEEQEAS